MFQRSREIIIQSSKWDCLLTPTVTLKPQPLEKFLAITERVAEDDLAVGGADLHLVAAVVLEALGQPLAEPRVTARLLGLLRHLGELTAES